MGVTTPSANAVTDPLRVDWTVNGYTPGDAREDQNGCPAAPKPAAWVCMDRPTVHGHAWMIRTPLIHSHYVIELLPTPKPTAWICMDTQKLQVRAWTCMDTLIILHFSTSALHEEPNDQLTLLGPFFSTQDMTISHCTLGRLKLGGRCCHTQPARPCCACCCCVAGRWRAVAGSAGYLCGLVWF